MNDKELLEFAAKAAGVSVNQLVNRYDCWEDTPILIGRAWNPLTDDGNALRLAVKLKMEILHSQLNDFPRWVSAVVKNTTTHAAENYLTVDKCMAATRRAIVRAAAEIGKTITP